MVRPTQLALSFLLCPPNIRVYIYCIAHKSTLINREFGNDLISLRTAATPCHRQMPHVLHEFSLFCYYFNLKNMMGMLSVSFTLRNVLSLIHEHIGYPHPNPSPILFPLADSGNGVFFQWVQCAGIYCVGLIVHLFRNAPTFHPLTMLGGALWCTGMSFLVFPTHFVSFTHSMMGLSWIFTISSLNHSSPILYCHLHSPHLLPGSSLQSSIHLLHPCFPLLSISIYTILCYCILCVIILGNMLCVPIINRLGLGIGLSCWGAVSMISGWLSGVTGKLLYTCRCIYIIYSYFAIRFPMLYFLFFMIYFITVLYYYLYRYVRSTP